jgi:hypothetical protein
MQSKNVKWLAVALVALPVLAFGQLKAQLKPQSFSQLLTQPQGLVGLIGLDPNRFSMQQSYSLSYMSLGGHDFSQGVYLNTMSYRFSEPLQVSLQWGVMNQPLSGLGVPSLYQNGIFLSGASVEYKPSRNLSIGVQYNRRPGGLWYRGYPYYDDSRLRPAESEEEKPNRY